uniref:G-protein coupled receptors family 1 profile domain-containing protein n=1 Tax=Plectus sambesii TaxID=2011161 RepID=A0A914WQ93_9BILA
MSTNSSDYSDDDELLIVSDLKLGIAALPTEVVALMGLFVVLFIFGISGNLGVIVFVSRTLWKLHRAPGARLATHQLYIYVIALATVDFLVLSVIPLMLPYLYTGQWLVGETLCRAFWTIENMNKILSIALLTVMSVERYMTVCHPIRSRFLMRKAYVYFVLIAAVGLTGVLLAPILSYVQLYEIKIGSTTLTNCVTPMPDQLFVAFIVYMFLIAYCLPALVIFFCYTMLIVFVKHRYERRRQALENDRHGSHAAIHRLSTSVIRVTAFHFACWTPFWFSVIFPLLLDDDMINRHSRTLMTVRLFVTALPYVNSACNWVFYALLNRELREQVLRHLSPPHTTNQLMSSPSWRLSTPINHVAVIENSAVDEETLL